MTIVMCARGELAPHWVSSSLRVLGCFATLAVVAPPLAAQRPTSTDSTCSYAQCALRVEGRRLVRGSDGETVASHGFFTPRHLAPFVEGDSARFYAGRYERDMRRATWLSAVGGLAGGVMYVAALRAHGQCDGFNACPENVAVSAGAVISVISYIAALRVGGRAERAESRALWWHNSRFTH